MQRGMEPYRQAKEAKVRDNAQITQITGKRRNFGKQVEDPDLLLPPTFCLPFQSSRMQTGKETSV